MFVLVAVLSNFTNSRPKTNSGSGDSSSQVVQEQFLPDPGDIPGLAAVDVYEPLESRGFEVKSERMSDSFYGGSVSMWTCTSFPGVVVCSVDFSGRSADSIRSVRAIVSTSTAAAAHSRPIAEELIPFIATLPYDGATPREARAWVLANLGNNTSRVFGSVYFGLISADVGGYVLRLSPATADQVEADQKNHEKRNEQVETDKNIQAKRNEKEKNRSDEKARRDAIADDEKALRTARGYITLTRQAIDNGKTGFLQVRWMEFIIAKFPDTVEAKEAAELLDKL